MATTHKPIAVIDIDLAGGMRDIRGYPEYRQAHVLVRYRRRPICRLWMSLAEGAIAAADLWTAAERELGTRLKSMLLRDLMFEPSKRNQPAEGLPSCSVVICTRDRPDDLRRCIESLLPGLGAGVEVIVVDNCPSDDRSERLAAQYPVRYCREPRPGQNWARARGARLASNEIVLYIDDDVKVDRDWIVEIRKPFADKQVGAVTGSISPLELEHAGQVVFEQYMGFYRGFQETVYHSSNLNPLAAGVVGAGANMAIRRSLVLDLKLFDAQLDGGTETRSGGDLYGFYRLLRSGYSIAYAPAALVWHRHRRTEDEVRRMLFGYNVGVYCVFLRCFTVHRDLGALLACAYWFRQYHLRELWRSWRRKPGSHPLPLVWSEVKGVFAAPAAFLRSLRSERRLGPLSEITASEPVC